MARKRTQLTEEQVKELKRAYASCKDGPTRTRFQAVWLYGSGYPTEEVMSITGCAWSTLMEWYRTYRRSGIAGLRDKRVGGNHAQLAHEAIKELGERLRIYTPANLFGPQAATADGQFWTVEDLSCAVQRWYGVSYRSRGSYHRLFDRCDFSYHRPAKVYKSRSDTKIAEFEEQLEKKR
jgi:transposase